MLVLLAACLGPPAHGTACKPWRSLQSITHEITSESTAGKSPAPKLVLQTLPPIDREAEVLASQRRVPTAPHSAASSLQRLEWEFNETRAFLNKQLRKDPRLKPDDIVVETDHMDRCTSCEHDTGLHEALHGAPVAIGRRTQLLVDDWLVHSWQNVARVLEPPAEEREVQLLAARRDERFGCPCSALETADGKVKLYYSSGPTRKGRPPDLEHKDFYNRYSYQISADGVGGWGGEHGPVYDTSAHSGMDGSNAGGES